MNFTFIVKASTSMGFGHLIRSRALAESIAHSCKQDDQLNFFVVGDRNLSHLLDRKVFSFRSMSDENELIDLLSENPTLVSDIVIFDSLEVSEALYERCKAATLKVSLSPEFSHIAEVDLVFHRTRHISGKLAGSGNVFSGLQYAIIQKNCIPISLSDYKNTLAENRLSIAIAMGGGDAANKTLDLLDSLNRLENACTVWVMLGEGYQHSYDSLIDTSGRSRHEIILAKTNESMWKVLKQAALLIVPGGVTSYEAAYAGLPTINITDNPSRKYLVQELLENGVALAVDSMQDDELLTRIQDFDDNRNKLLEMHLGSKGLIDGNAPDRIFEQLLAELRNL